MEAPVNFDTDVVRDDVPDADCAIVRDTLDKVLGFKILKILACKSACCFAMELESVGG